MKKPSLEGLFLICSPDGGVQGTSATRDVAIRIIERSSPDWYVITPDGERIEAGSAANPHDTP